MAIVFLSYRKSDSGSEAGRLADSLRPVFGRKIVFRDVDSIMPGADWEAVLRKQVSDASVVLVLIGPGWLHELEARLVRTGIDYHRMEMAMALEKGTPVIPILLREAALPREADLPKELSSLTQRQAMAMRDESWAQDVDRLVDAVGRPYRWGVLALRIAIALVLALVVDWQLIPRIAPDEEANYVFLRWSLIAICAVYAFIELALGYRYLLRRKRALAAMRSARRAA